MACYSRSIYVSNYVSLLFIWRAGLEQYAFPPPNDLCNIGKYIKLCTLLGVDMKSGLIYNQMMNKNLFFDGAFVFSIWWKCSFCAFM